MMKIKKIIVLCLDTESSKHKLKECLDSISESDMDCPVSISYGIDGNSEEVPLGLTKGRWDGDLSHLKGSRAVCYSHLNLIMGAVGECPNNEDCVMVLEYDVRVNPNIRHYLNTIDIPEDSDFLHLSYWDTNVGSANQLVVADHVSKVVNDGCTGMFSYIVNPRRVYSRMINSLPFTCEVDNFFSSDAMRRVFNIYVIEHNPWLTEHVSEASVRNNCDDKYWHEAQTKPQKIISFTLWGDQKIYLQGIKENLKLAKVFYPEWVVHIYCDPPTFLKESTELKKLGAKVFNIDNMHPSYARLLPLNTHKDSIVIFRDADSRFSFKEVSAVNEWLDSDKTLHVMKDHEYHTNDILCGMFGIKPHNLPHIELDVRYTSYGDDEKILSNNVWNKLCNDVLIHGEGFGGIPYPEDDLSLKGEYVGMKHFVS